MPIASILVPVYNRAHLVERTIQSALAQTVQDIEVVVVDNCSTDDTYAVCQRIAAADPRVKVFRNETNIGPVRNWQRCAQLATAPYAKILFSDDLMAPAFIERTLPYMLQKDCSLVFTPAIVGAEDWQGQLHYRNFMDDTRIGRDLFVRAAVRMGGFFTPVSPGAALFRTSDLRRFIVTELPGVQGYDFSATGAGVDWLIYGLTAMQYPWVGYVNDALVYFHQHAGSISISNENNLVPQGYALAQQWFLSQVKGL
jgi:glycosyltransferase involved in cell wall biosynthesis